jgi:xanthine dehydrogenase accessory factor
LASQVFLYQNSQLAQGNVSSSLMSSESREINQALREMLETGVSAVLVTLVESPKSGAGLEIGTKILVDDSGRRIATLGWPPLDDAIVAEVPGFLSSRDEAKLIRAETIAPDISDFAGAALLFERIEAEPQLVIAGAGHVGAALARLAALVGYRVMVIDDRAEFLRRELFNSDREAGIELVVAEDWHDALRNATVNGRGVSVAIVTRGHKQDEECLRAAIAAKPDYIGMIGSKRRTNIVLEKLREEGACDQTLQRVRAPIGLDIGAVSPEEVALAILAEIVAERRGGSGAALSSWRRA